MLYVIFHVTLYETLQQTNANKMELCCMIHLIKALQLSATTMSATTVCQVGRVRTVLSATTMSATAVCQVGRVRTVLSATTMSATAVCQVGRVRTVLSATTMSATAVCQVGRVYTNCALCRSDVPLKSLTYKNHLYI